MSKIHETAIIDASAKLGSNVEIAAYSIVQKNVRIGDNTKIQAHTVIEDYAEIGSLVEVGAFCHIAHHCIREDNGCLGRKRRVA